MIHEDSDVAYSFFVLVDGEAEVRRRNRRVATLGPGDCFGELALIPRRPRNATVTLTTPSRLLSISAHNFRPLLGASPAIQFKLLEAPGGKTRTVHDIAAELPRRLSARFYRLVTYQESKL